MSSNEINELVHRVQDMLADMKVRIGEKKYLIAETGCVEDSRERQLYLSMAIEYVTAAQLGMGRVLMFLLEADVEDRRVE